MTDDRPPRLLLVEDDPVSRAWLQAALERVPATVDAAPDCASALPLAQAAGHDLLVIDAHLPDGRGDALLQRLREAGIAAPAIAHTAAREGAEHRRLLDAGFLDVLVKPLSTAVVVAAVRAALQWTPRVADRPQALEPARLWDDETALKAVLGDRAQLDALRGLFRPELETVRDAARASIDAGDEAALRFLLHRLRASCGFVGAARLGDAAARLAATGVAAWPEFEDAVAQTLAAFPGD